jgi:hypothetical protein
MVGTISSMVRTISSMVGTISSMVPTILLTTRYSSRSNNTMFST